MAIIVNLLGQKFGRLLVVDQKGRSKQQNVLWLCRCDCGNEVTVNSAYLKSGHTSSCGCLKSEESIKRFTTHGKTKTRIYNIWASMNQRCLDKRCKSYNSYGGKGIAVCEEWRDFIQFERWAIENGYNESLTIDRIDCFGSYCPENCQWISFEENRKKHKDSIMLSCNRITDPLKTWCDKLGLPTQTVRRFYHKYGKHETERGICNVIDHGDIQFFRKRKKK